MALSVSTVLMKEDLTDLFLRYRTKAEEHEIILKKRIGKVYGSNITSPASKVFSIEETDDNKNNFFSSQSKIQKIFIVTVVDEWYSTLKIFNRNVQDFFSMLVQLRKSQIGLLTPKFSDDNDESQEYLHLQLLTEKVKAVLSEMEHYAKLPKRRSEEFSSQSVHQKSMTDIPDKNINSKENGSIVSFPDVSAIGLSLSSHLSSLVSLYIDLFKGFQQDFLQRITSQERKAQNFRNTGSEETKRELHRESRTAKYMEQNLSMEKIALMIAEDEFQEQQREEIKEIVKSIYDLQDLFQQVNISVQYQGTILDRLDHCLSVAEKASASGVQELQQAEKNHSRCIIQ